MSKLFQYGGIVASIILIAFGAGSIVTGYNGRDRVHNDLAREQIVGTPDSSIPNQLVNNGSKAEAFAKVMRKHTLEATGGQTYSQMGRYMGKNGKATNDEKAAAVDPKSGKPIDNPLRNLWVTETALTTALHSSYFAESVATFAMVMGFALMLVGGGFLVLTLRVLRVFGKEEKVRRACGRDGRGRCSRADLPRAGPCRRPPKPPPLRGLRRSSMVFRTRPRGRAGWHVGARARMIQRPASCVRLDMTVATTRREHTMFKTIVVGVDGREGGRMRSPSPPRCSACSARLVAVHAFPYDYYLGRGADGEYEDAIHDARGRDRCRRSSSAPACRRAGVRGRRWLAGPRPAPCRDRARRRPHRRRLGPPRARGSRAGRRRDRRHPARRAVPGPRRAARATPSTAASCETIGVGFDGSPESRAALELAHQIAEAAGARLRVIDVVVPARARRTLPGLPPRLGRARAHPPRGGRGARWPPCSPSSATSRPATSRSATPRRELAYAATGPRPAGHRLARLRPDPAAHAGQHLEQAGARGAVPRARATRGARIEDDGRCVRGRLGGATGERAASDRDRPGRVR